MRYVVEITDSSGQACKIRLSLPLNKNTTRITNSSWRVLDEGFLKFRSGGCEISGRTSGPNELLIAVGKTHYATLNEFVDTYGIANDSGDGKIYQQMCVNFKPGAMSWVLIS